MADRSVLVTLRANVASFMASMRGASKAAEDFATKNRAEMETVGRGLLGVGTAAIGGLGLATKAAIDWESAWAGVTKTVDGSEQQLAALEQDLRDMAKELPASHEEIAAVAEAAGQLGVQTPAVADFTRTMVDLGETTNLTAEQAATALARFSNIMGTSQEDVDRLGSTLVDLGNNSETTEAEILELSTRLAAAGNIAGLSESDVLAFGATLTSVGVRAEAGGTALSKTFTTVRDAVLDGGDALDTFAQVAGTTAEEFAADFRSDPAMAIASFIEGLGRMNAAGESTTGVFEDLELTDQRLMRALLSTAEAGDLLTDSLERGETAWHENIALTEEAQRRYDTASAQISMAWNSVRDAAIEVGSVVAPVAADIVGFIGDLADAFGDLPEGVDIAAASILGLVGVASALGGAFLLFAPRIVETKAAIETLGVTSGKTGKAVRGLNSAARFAGKGLAALLIADQINRLFGEGEDDLRRYAEQLEATAGDDLKAKIRATKDEIADLEKITGDVADIDLGPFGHFWNTWDSDVLQAADRTDFLKERLKELEHQLELEKIQAEQSGGATDEFGGQLDESATAAEEATEALQEYMDQLKAMTDPVFAMFDALDAVEQAQDDYNAAVKKYGRDSDEAQAASIRLLRELEGLEQAALNGDLTFEDFSARLKTWVERGKLTEEQAADIRDRVKQARGEAEEFQGDYEADMEARTSKAEAEINGLISRAKDWDGSTYSATVNLGATGMNVGRFFGAAGIDRHSGGLIMHDGGFVPPRMHSGGLSRDERPAILQTGEFVVQRPAVQSLGVDAMRAINQGQMPGGQFTGNLYLSSGEFLGVVDGRVEQGISEHDRALKSRVRAGTGRAR